MFLHSLIDVVKWITWDFSHDIGKKLILLKPLPTSMPAYRKKFQNDEEVLVSTLGDLISNLLDQIGEPL